MSSSFFGSTSGLPCPEDSEAPRCNLERWWYWPFLMLALTIVVTVGFAVARHLGYCVIKRDPWNPIRKPNQSDEDYAREKARVEAMYLAEAGLKNEKFSRIK